MFDINSSIAKSFFEVLFYCFQLERLIMNLNEIIYKMFIKKFTTRKLPFYDTDIATYWLNCRKVSYLLMFATVHTTGWSYVVIF
jgi:hypothetical protein